MRKLKCGVIGLGRLGSRHASNLMASIPEAELVAVSDVSQEALDRFTETFPKVCAYLDYNLLLADKEIEAVIIASPTSMHAPLLQAAILAGKKVFCEKPLAMKLEEAKKLQKLVDERQAFVQLGFMRRFDSGYAQAKKRIDSGEIGKPVSILAIGRDPGCPPLEFAKHSGGLIIDMAIHDIDLCRWFFGCEVTEVYAKGGVVRFPELEKIGDIDHASVSLQFENGKLAILEVSRNALYGYDIRTEIVCENGACFVGQLQKEPNIVLKPGLMAVSTMPGFLERFADAYLNEMKVFVADVLANRSKAAVGVSDGVASMEIAEAINISLKTNRPVKLAKEVIHG
ncbi:MAG: Gfo/Idh/MocA family oxidoreductase [Sphaerochaetaceae bacterium]